MIFLNTIPKKLAFLLILVLPVLLSAQAQDNSPYSRFGFGDIEDNNFFYSQYMGGLGASYHSPYNINIVNPASLSYLAATSFDIGMNARLSDFDDGTNSQRLWSGNISYMSLAFPLQNKLNDLLDRKVRDYTFGMAFTLKPYSTVGYNVSSRVFIDDIGVVDRQYQGNGGTYDFTWSNGMRYKNLSFGLNLGYLFGKTTNQRIINFEDIEFGETTLTEEENSYKGFIWRAGFIYDHKFKSKVDVDGNAKPAQHISIGIHANSSTTLNTINDVFSGTALFGNNGTILRDTLSFNTVNGTNKLPAELGAGITYFAGEKLALGVNYTTTRWSQFDPIFVKGTLNDTYKLSFGGYIRPNYKSIGNYFSRVFYRFGTYYNKLPIQVAANNGNDVDDIGVTFGLGLPFFYQRKISHANLGINLGIRGRNTFIEERYMRLTFSFTFNDDEWFVKRKYN